MTRNETIKAIRTALRTRSGKAWSVKGGRGTSYGWITITSPPRRQGCHERHNYGTYDGQLCLDCEQPRDAVKFKADGSVDGTGICQSHRCNVDDGRYTCHGGDITPADRQELADLLGVTVHHQGVSIPGQSDFHREYIARAAGLTPAVVGVANWD